MANSRRAPLWVGAASIGVLLVFYLSFSGRAGSMVGAVAQTGRGVLSPVIALWTQTAQALGLRAENARAVEELRSEIELDRRELAAAHLVHEELAHVRREKEELERLLGFRPKMPWKNLAARVTLRDPQNLFASLVLDRGLRDGVADGDPVVAVVNGDLALVGRVADSGPDSCKVMTLVDPRHQVVVEIPQAGQGIAVGQAPSHFGCVIDYIDRRAEMLDGKVAVTAGTGGRYPKGILVGDISGGKRKRYGIFQQATLTPRVNFFSVETVFVLRQADGP